MRFSLSPVLFVLSVLPATALAQDAPLHLKYDSTIDIKRHGDESSPIFLSAQRMEGKKDSQLEAVGDAELRRQGQSIAANRLLYKQQTREIVADGAVRIEQGGDMLTGMHLDYNLNSRKGKLLLAEYQLADGNAHGNAESVHMEGKSNYILHKVTYTTCPVGNSDWMLEMGKLDIDRTTEIGVAHQAYVEFKGVPILYSPWMDFPLKGQRKSGLLAPVFGSTTTGGAEITLPVYLNLAPNYDATVAPRHMSKRGTMLNNEFRYLGEDYYGELQLDILSRDQLLKRSRARQSYQQKQNLGGGFTDTVNFTRVSDDAYYRDLATTVAGTSQVNLLREGVLNYDANWWNVATRVQTFQTLQDPLVPVAIPYRRLPQVLLTAQREDHEFNSSVTGEYVAFSHPTALNAQRLVLYPSVSYPLLNDSGYYLTPKAGVHSVTYAFGRNNLTQTQDTTVNVPIFSLDSGMAFEHDMTLESGRNLVQTFEPRIFYVYIPYRNQDALPNFDTALSTFSYSQIFSENRFLGGDRVGDANQVTLAATTRLLDGENGAELLKAMVAERFSFTRPRVNLVQTAVTPTVNAAAVQGANINKSDILASLSGRFSNTLSFDALMQYNPAGLGAEMYSVMGRYQPEPGKVMNVGYRFASPNINPNLSMRQIDISEQWPLFGRWHSVARWNYSMLEKRMLEGLVGLEYNQSCWVARLVLQRFTTATSQVSTSVFVQLDLTGLAGIGADPMDALRRSVPGYTKLNQASTGSSGPGFP